MALKSEGERWLPGRRNPIQGATRGDSAAME
jgi:hypothetical protein